MDTNSNDTEAKQPASAGCIPRLVLGSSDTPETDEMASMRRTHQEWQTHGEQLERRLNDLYEITLTAIGILDGNKEVIDWRDRDHPELLRKLCEHLEAQCGRFLPENSVLSRPESVDNHTTP